MQELFPASAQGATCFSRRTFHRGSARCACSLAWPPPSALLPCRWPRSTNGWQRRAAPRSPPPASSAFGIVERECYRLFSGRRKTEALPQALEDALQAAPAPQQLRHDLAAAMARLAPHYREILILRNIEELSAPEAAAHLGISVAAVKSRLHRARALMREQLLAGGYRADGG